MKHPKTNLKQGYYYEEIDLYDSLPDEIEVPEYETEIFSETMTSKEILEKYNKKKNATYNQHCKNCVVKFPSGRGKVHPTEKPLKLFKHLIEVSSNPGDLVFDPFAGSGTTAVASKNLNRNYIVCELNEEYVEIIKNRLSTNKEN